MVGAHGKSGNLQRCSLMGAEVEDYSCSGSSQPTAAAAAAAAEAADLSEESQ